MARDGRVVLWLGAAVFVVFLAVYLATPTSNYTFDAVSYATAVRYADMAGAKPLLHPHHLAFNALGYFTWHAARVFSPEMESIRALQIMNAGFGALGLGVFFLVLSAALRATTARLSVGQRTTLALVSTAALGVSFGWWAASTDGRANIPPMAAMLAAFYFAWLTGRTGLARYAASAGVFTAIAAVLHQSHGMFVLVCAAGVAMAPVGGEQKLQLGAVLAGAFVAALGVPYLAALGIRGIYTLDGAQRWMLAYAHEGIWWDFRVGQNLVKDANALVHAYIATSSSARALGPVAISVVVRVVFVVTVGMAVGAVLGGKLVGSRGRTGVEGAKGGSSGKEVVRSPLVVFNVLLGAWMLLYGAFFTVWAPGYFAFWIPVAAAGVMALAVNAASRAAIPLMAAGALFLGAVNLTQYVLPHMPEESNKSVAIAREVGRITPKGSFVMVAGMGYLAQMEVYVPYFANRRVISLNQVMGRHGTRGLEVLRADAEAKIRAGKRVFVVSDVLDSQEAWRQLTKRYGITESDLARTFRGFEMKPVGQAGSQRVFELVAGKRHPLNPPLSRGGLGEVLIQLRDDALDSPGGGGALANELGAEGRARGG